MEEIDWSTGEILKALKEAGIDKNTLVLFTSDNGPWAIMKLNGGSPGILTGEKGATFEGGMREPTIFWWPGKIRPGVVGELASTMDVFTTCITLAGGRPPTDRVIDGVDISPALLGTGSSPRQTMFFYRGTKLYAVRHGQLKAHFTTRSGYGSDKAKTHDPPLLYHLGHDPGEKFNVAAAHPEVIAQIRKIARAHQKKLVPGEPQLGKVLSK